MGFIVGLVVGVICMFLMGDAWWIGFILFGVICVGAILFLQRNNKRRSLIYGMVYSLFDYWCSLLFHMVSFCYRCCKLPTYLQG